MRGQISAYRNDETNPHAQLAGVQKVIEIFPILGETATTIEPCDGSLDDPTLG